MSGAARRLARFVRGLALDSIPAPIVARGVDLVLDTLGNALAAVRARTSAARSSASRRALGGAPESALLGSAGPRGGGQRRARQRDARPRARLRRHARGRHRAHGLRRGHDRAGGGRGDGGERARGARGAASPAVEVMCRVGLAVPGALHARHFHPTAITASFAAAAAAGQAARPDRGPARARLRDLRQPGVAASSSTWPTARGRSGCIPAGPRTPAWSRRSWRAPGSRGRRRCSKARTASTRRSRAATTPARLDGAAREPRPHVGDRRAHAQAVPVRLDRAAVHGLRGAAARAPRGPRRETIAAIRCRTAPGPVPRLWEPLAAKHAPRQRLRREVQPAVPARLDPRARPGRPRRVHRRGGARARACCGVAKPVSYELDPTHRLPAAVRRRRRGHAGTTGACSTSGRTVRAAVPTRR